MQNEIWDSLRMAGPFHGGFCCRWLSAVSGLALILPALVSDPMSSVSGMGGAPQPQLVLGAKTPAGLSDQAALIHRSVL